MNFKPLILVAVLTLAVGAHAAPKAKATKARANKTPVVSATTMPAVQSGVHLSDGIAAVVDNEVITHRQVEQAVAQARQTMPKGTQMDANELRQQVLAQMINQSLILQAGKRRNIQATDSEIEAVIAHNPNIKNPSAAVRQDIADSIIVEKVRQQAIMQNSRVSDSEVARYIEQAKQQGVTLPEADPVRQYHAQHILIKARQRQCRPSAQKAPSAKSTHKPAAAQISAVWHANTRKTAAPATAAIWAGLPTA